MAAMTDDTAGFAGGYLRYLTRDCVISPTPFPATHLVQACDDGWTLADAPGDDSGIPVAILAPEAGSWPLGVAMIVSVHTHDASAATCPASIASRCDSAIVLDRIVWSADPSNPTGSPTPSPTIPPADPPHQEGRWTRVGGNAIDRFGGFFQLWPTDGALFATAVEGESDDGGAIMTVLSTEDGVRWHVMGRIQQSADYLTSFIRFQGHFVAVSEAEDRAQVWYSDDGADWTWVGDQPAFVFDADGGSSEPPHTELQISRVFAVADHLEIVGRLHCYCGPPGERMAIWTSPTGSTWDRVPAARLQGLPELYPTWVDQGLILASASYDQTYTSTDGIAWTRLRGIPHASIFPTRLGYFAVQQYRGAESKQWVSPDLKHWTRVGDIETGVPETDQSYGYAAGFRIATGGIIVAVSGDETKQIIVSWSADGRTWRHEIIHERYPTHVQDIAVMGHHVVLSGEVDRNADHSQQVLWVADLPTP